MEQNFKCTGNCLNCMPAQRQYCSSQHSYSNMKVLDAMMEIVMEMKGSVEEMKVKIEAIQNNEANVFDPTEEQLIIRSVRNRNSPGVFASASAMNAALSMRKNKA